MFFRTKVRIHTCKVILLTSLVWFLVDVFLLTFYSDCMGRGCGKSSSDENVLPSSGGDTVTSSKGRGILYEQLHDRGKKAYQNWELRKWRAAPPVRPIHGMPGELGKPVNIPADQEAIMKEKFKLNQFNILASDMISLNRSLQDIRQEGYVFFFK